jgi:ABC-2 type transport system permease protein
MPAIFLKEIRSFFSTLQGFVIIALFLLIVSMFLWVIPGAWNIPGSGYATLNGLFELAPWVFLFLVPAISMRLFSEEYRTGTIELLLTRPVSATSIVWAKYLAALSIIVIAILPTTVFAVSLHFLALPAGNIDWGAIAGSYVALFFLGAVYASIGLCASAATKNQVVAFLAAAAMSFLFYSGFGLLSTIPGVPLWISQTGIETHYLSMSRGLLDSRDFLYFLSVLVLFNLTTIELLKSRNK